MLWVMRVFRCWLFMIPGSLSVLDGLVDDECLVLGGLSSVFVDPYSQVILTTSHDDVEVGVQPIDVDSPIVDGECNYGQIGTCFSGVSANYTNRTWEVDGHRNPYHSWNCLGVNGRSHE